jgi:hypothetical protein
MNPQPLQTDPINPTPPQYPPRQGRGGTILGFGIAALLILGPILGVPAWVMGHRDLKRIKSGEITSDDRTPTQIGMVLGIVGTFFSPATLIVGGIFLAVVLSLIAAQSVQADKDAMMAEAKNISTVAYQYYVQPKDDQGGGGSYEGFALSEQMSRTHIGAYQVKVVSPDKLQIIGSSLAHIDNGLIADVNERGVIVHWEFSGDFAPWMSPREYPNPSRKRLPRAKPTRGV